MPPTNSPTPAPRKRHGLRLSGTVTEVDTNTTDDGTAMTTYYILTGRSVESVWSFDKDLEGITFEEGQEVDLPVRVAARTNRAGARLSIGIDSKALLAEQKADKPLKAVAGDS